MAEEPRYSLREAQRELALQECASGGHYPVDDILTGRGMAIYCSCECGLYVWVRQSTRCEEVGRQGQQCLRPAGHDGEHAGELRVPTDV